MIKIAKKYIFPLILISLLITFSSCSTIQTKDNEKESYKIDANVDLQQDDKQEERDKDKVEETVTTYSKVTLLGAGDNLIHNTIYKQAQKRAGGSGFDFTCAYENVADLIASADISVLNQETVLASKILPLSNYPNFNSPIEVGKHMSDIGFDVINQANNHSLDTGVKGLEATLDFWETLPSITVVGAYKNQEDTDNIKTIIKNDITFSFLGYTEQTNGYKLPEDTQLKLIYTKDETVIKSQIEKAKDISDVVVVSVHWGEENSHAPTQNQKDLAKKMISWGASIIFGHHSHCLQPVEYITAEDGRTGIVAYSLGNFISHQSTAKTMLGGLMNVEISKNNQTGETSITGAKLTPIVTHFGSGGSNLTVYPFNKYTKEMADKHGVKNKDSSFSYEYLQNIINTVIDKKFL